MPFLHWVRLNPLLLRLAGTLTRLFVKLLARNDPALEGLEISVPQGAGVHVPPWEGSALAMGTNAAVVISEKGVPACAETTELSVQPPRTARSTKLCSPLPGSS